MDARERRISYYETGGHCPFRDWFATLRDRRIMAAIDARIARFRTGNLGDSRPIGKGASEAVIDLGPGYRIYFGQDGNAVVLLAGGDKSSQASDIGEALSYWENYKERKSRDRKEKRL